jgi:hypothetical protein
LICRNLRGARLQLEKERHEERPLFSSEDLEARFADLWELAERFKTSYEAEFSVRLALNIAPLYLIIISTYDDIARYKFYHLSNPYEERSDAIKRAAYLTKWITRFKPFRVVRDQVHAESLAEASRDGADLVNEFFAVSVALVNLNLHTDKDFVLSAQKEYELVYDLLYRYLSDDALMLFYQTLVDWIICDKDVIEIQ